MSEYFTKDFGDLSCLPMCVLKDDMVLGERIGRVCINDIFKPSPKLLPRAMGAGYIFTKYHFHDGIEILRILSGDAVAVINNKSYKVSAGDVLIINSYEAHGLYLESSDTPFSRICVIFKPKDVFPSGDGNSVFDRLRALRFKNYLDKGCERVRSSLDKMVEIAERGGSLGAVDEIAALVDFYSSAISEGAAADSDSSTPYQREFVTRIADFVEQRLLERITTEQAADYCKYSTEHFCRLFKECFGTTFKDYLTSCRIKLARDKIDSGEINTVSELYSSVGFLSQNHFSAMFYRHIGTTPSEYIKKKRK